MRSNENVAMPRRRRDHRPRLASFVRRQRRKFRLCLDLKEPIEKQECQA